MDPGAKKLPTRLERAGLLVAAGLFLVDQLRVLIGAGIRFTNEDQTIFWYVAQDYLHLHFPEPLFYGSPYSSHLEALIAAPLLAFRIGPHVAVPLASAGLGAAPWVLFARAAWKRGLPRVAIGVLAATLLLPVEYVGINTQAAHGTGAALAGIAAALILEPSVSAGAWFAFALINVLALLLYPNAIFITAPAALVVGLTRYRERRVWIWGGGGALVGVGLYALARHFYTANPSYLLHPQWPLDFHWDRLMDGVSHLDRHLGTATPFGLNSWGLLVFGTAVAVGLMLHTRRWELGLAAVLVALGVIASLGISKTHDGSASITFAYGRVFQAVPLTIAFLAVLWSGEAPSLMSTTGNLVLATLLLGLMAWREATLGREIDRMMSVGSPVVTVTPTARVLATCGDIANLAASRGVELVINRESRVDTYGCGALWYGSLETIYPPYDRRTRRLFEERDRVRHVFLIAEADPQICARATSLGMECEFVAPQRCAVVRAPATSAINLSAQLGIPVRRF